MNLFDFADFLFDMVASGFAMVGAVVLLVAAAITLHLLLFQRRARDVRARVVAHENVTLSQDKETGREIRSYQPVFELVDGERLDVARQSVSDAASAVQSRSSQVHRRNSYPIGTEWPARYNPATGKIRTSRDLDFWPMAVLVMWILGIAFIVVPNLDDGLGDEGLAYMFGGIGLATMIGGVFSAIRVRQRQARWIDVMAQLTHIEVARDTERARYDVPVLRITSGDYEGTESAEVSIAQFSRDDIGQVMRAHFDPYTGQIFASEGRFKALGITPGIIGTGAIFIAIGVALGMGAI